MQQYQVKSHQFHIGFLIKSPIKFSCFHMSNIAQCLSNILPRYPILIEWKPLTSEFLWLKPPVPRTDWLFNLRSFGCFPEMTKTQGFGVRTEKLKVSLLQFYMLLKEQIVVSLVSTQRCPINLFVDRFRKEHLGKN